jgi:hypothetical protein
MTLELEQTPGRDRAQVLIETLLKKCRLSAWSAGFLIRLRGHEPSESQWITLERICAQHGIAGPEHEYETETQHK